ncbi:hypothetical protein V8E54_013121 [Elaphomyces granulatus]
MTGGQCDANASYGFLLIVCMGIFAVVGMPKTRNNLNFVFPFFLACFAWLSSASLCQLQYYNNFFCPCNLAGH